MSMISMGPLLVAALAFSPRDALLARRPRAQCTQSVGLADRQYHRVSITSAWPPLARLRPEVLQPRAAVSMSSDDLADSQPQRVSIKVSGPAPVLAKLATACRMEGGVKRGLTGVVYGLKDGRIEVVCEGKRIDKFVEWVDRFVQQECSGESEACEVATVKARDLDSKTKAMYGPQFPVVNFDTDTRRVRINLKGDLQVLDYTLRHTKIEAGFNRKLEYESKWLKNDRAGMCELELTAAGPVQQLKSFVRWCKRGPPMQRPDSVSISWVDDMPIDEAQAMSTAFRDEGVSA